MCSNIDRTTQSKEKRHIVEIRDANFVRIEPLVPALDRDIVWIANKAMSNGLDQLEKEATESQ